MTNERLMHFIASSLMLLLAYVAGVGIGDFSHGLEFPLPFPPGGGTAIYGLYGYVPL